MRPGWLSPEWPTMENTGVNNVKDGKYEAEANKEKEWGGWQAQQGQQWSLGEEEKRDGVWNRERVRAGTDERACLESNLGGR